ncbi:MAG TPA: phosphoethanolamine--lipid A transferase [Luteimonas sp.]|nr:phosphoethanolamine--lipid A transferase [Luteimonas sp.]
MATTAIAQPASSGIARWLRLRPTVSTEALALLASVFFTAACNYELWHVLVADLHAHAGLLVAVFVFATALHAFLLGLVLTRWTARPLLTVLFAATAFAAYYMGTYKVYLDPDMIRNVLETDPREAGELLVPALVPSLLGLAVLPIAVLWRLRLRRRPLLRALWIRLAFLAGMLVLAAGGALSAFQDLSALARNHREVRYLVTPSNYVVSLSRVLFASPPGPARPLLPIGEDAREAPRAAGARPRLLVFVLGETVRAQNWGLDGYLRQTTPRLAAMPDVVNFPDTSSCGTSTEVSVPCLFSPYGRHAYDEARIRGHQSLLHVLQRAGVQVLWRDNQSGCKRVCDGLEFESMADATDPALCNGKRCFDEILLSGLQARIVPDGRDRIVVLHQLGNHGPAYYQRYPPAFRRFTPTCDTEQLGDCSRQRIVNSYDNAVLYTDHVLARTIEMLKDEPGYDTALVYVSDHGESLGENGLFLHGVPHAIAPSQQTHVPMVMWFSPGFARRQGLDLACVRQIAQGPASHDNLFPTILGMFRVRTRLYDPQLDLLRRCERARP